jgi:D-alanyl-D-alanine carboxypeptidase/D-alanyl-D-alanine-endopeptidase (penicillin-binding protein 4)
MKTRPQSVESSVKFVRLSDGKTLAEKDSGKLLIPASTSKLVTAAAALSQLDTNHSFKTDVYYSGTLNNGVISGDLIFKGSGDPFLVSEKIWEMAQDLKVMGIKEIKGSIVLDQSLYDNVDRDYGRMQAEKYSRNAYDAPILPMSVNFNTYTVSAVVDRRSGKAAVQIWPHPLPNLVSMQNNLRVEDGRSRIHVERSTRKGKSTVSVSGKISEVDGIKKFWKSVGDGGLASGEYIRSFLVSAGIKSPGKVKSTDGVKGRMTKLYTIQGYPLTKSIEGLNKYSNNFIADMLTKYLGAKSTGGKGTFSAGAKALENFLKRKVGVRTDFTLKNGSGLSTSNRLSADQLCDLLVFMQKRIELFPEFLASLPASGTDGTLKDRFKKYGLLKGKVRAKTGTLTQPVSVSSLAGYFVHEKHGWVAFAIIENGRKGKSQPSITSLRNLQEKLIYSL